MQLIKIILKTIMKTQTKNYIYTSKEMKDYMNEVLDKSTKIIFSQSINSRKDNKLSIHKKTYENNRFNESISVSWNSSKVIMSKIDSQLEIFNKFSKKSKKKVNKLLRLLELNPGNQNLLMKYMNFFSRKTDNAIIYSIVNSKEQEIAKARKEYKNVIKYLKMDLQAQLKETREKYKEIKGNFYK